MCYVSVMADSFSIRDLRNSTRDVLEVARRRGRVTITNHGRPVAHLTPVDANHGDWSSHVDDVIDALPEPRDTGLLDELAELDAASIDDLA